eukprot:1487329-Amphidinium_carterae.1
MGELQVLQVPQTLAYLCKTRSLPKGARPRISYVPAARVGQAVKNCPYFDVLGAIMVLHDPQRPLQSGERLRNTYRAKAVIGVPQVVKGSRHFDVISAVASLLELQHALQNDDVSPVLFIHNDKAEPSLACSAPGISLGAIDNLCTSGAQSNMHRLPLPASIALTISSMSHALAPRMWQLAAPFRNSAARQIIPPRTATWRAPRPMRHKRAPPACC